jgi:inner membrane protease subunit 1
VRVPPGSVWLQGDNAMNSTDSRDYGAVPEQMILGRALVRVWPPSGFGAVENSMGDCALADEARTAGEA